MKNTILIILLLCTNISLAQNTVSDKTYRSKPLWIDMMKQPNVNYHEAEKAFNLFWENKEIPFEEEELLGNSKDKKHQSKREIKEEKREGFFERLFGRKEDDAKKYTLQYKQFKHWLMMNEPYVQDDGTLLNQEQRLQIHQQQLSERK